jgi:hypothetical protein
MEEMKLKKGNEWAKCLCAEVDPSDRPCVVCEIWLKHKQTPPDEVYALFGEVPESDDRIRQMLLDGGFDDSDYRDGHWSVGCSQCVATAVNRHPVHEHGCPNQGKELREVNCG